MKSLVKSSGVLSGLDYNKALNSLDYNKAIGAIYRSFGSSSSDVQIPLPEQEKVVDKPAPRQRPEELTDVEIEQAILPIFDYFDANLQILNNSLGEKPKEVVMGRVWKVVLNVVENLLVPPLADTPSDLKPLSDKEVDIVFKWLKVCRLFFGIMFVTDERGSSCETISMLMGRDQSHLRHFKMRSIERFYQSVFIMIGIRMFFSFGAVIACNCFFFQRCAHGGMRATDATTSTCCSTNQTSEVCLCSQKSRYY